MKKMNRWFWIVTWALVAFWDVDMLTTALAQESYIPVLNPIHTQAGRALQPGLVSTGNIDATTATVTAATVLAGTANAQTMNVSGTLSMLGSAANIALGSNWVSADGGDEGLFVDSNGKVYISPGSSGVGLVLDSVTNDKGLEWTTTNGILQYQTHSSAAGHAFEIYNQATSKVEVHLDVFGNSYFNGGNVGIKKIVPNYDLEVGGTAAATTMAATTFIDWTPYYKGDALSEIAKIKADEHGNIDHATLGAARHMVDVTKEYIDIKDEKGLVKRLDRIAARYKTLEKEIAKEEAFETYFEDVIIEATTDRVEKVFQLAGKEVVEVTKPAFDKSINKVERTRLKPGVQFDQKTGKFYTTSQMLDEEKILENANLDTGTVEIVKEIVQEEGRDLGMSISRLEEGIRQLLKRVEALEERR